MRKILKYLQWKKGTIASIFLTIAGYLASKGYIWDSEIVLIWTLNTILFGYASHLTKWLYEK